MQKCNELRTSDFLSNCYYRALCAWGSLVRSRRPRFRPAIGPAAITRLRELRPLPRPNVVLASFSTSVPFGTKFTVRGRCDQDGVVVRAIVDPNSFRLALVELEVDRGLAPTSKGSDRMPVPTPGRRHRTFGPPLAMFAKSQALRRRLDRTTEQLGFPTPTVAEISTSPLACHDHVHLHR